MTTEQYRRTRKPAPAAIDLDQEDTGAKRIVINYAEELYSPVQYNTFKIGGHQLELVTRAGESTRQAFERGRLLLEELVDKEFEHRLRTFRERLKKAKGD